MNKVILFNDIMTKCFLRKEVVSIFKRIWERYYVEIIISFIGAIFSVITAAIEKDFSYDQIVIIAITLGIDTICLSNKELIKDSHENLKKEIENLNLISEVQELYNNLPEDWKRIARARMAVLRDELIKMADSLLILSGDPLIKYQANMLRNANNRIVAVHLALNEQSLKRWDEKQTTKDFTNILIKANMDVKWRWKIDKRRIFVIDNELLKQQEMLDLMKKLQKFKNKKCVLKLNLFPNRLVKRIIVVYQWTCYCVMMK